MKHLPVLKPVRSYPEPSVQPRWQAAIATLKERLNGDVRTAQHDRMLYATDASIYQVEPLCVILPASIDDAAEAMRLCAQHSLPILPRGGGTSLAGQCTNEAAVIDFSPSCRGLIDLDLVERTCQVEPGLTIDDLNDQLASHGLFFVPDPATARHANIGGCIGNNAAGARSIRYGRTSESVIGVDVCLADGERVTFAKGQAVTSPTVRRLTEQIVQLVAGHRSLIRQRFPKTVRRNAGYNLDLILDQLDDLGIEHPSPDNWPTILENVNLAPLLCGSEGTLAVTLGATLRLHPLPAAKSLSLIAYNSLEEAIDAVASILETRPSAVELLDETVLGLAAGNAQCREALALLPQIDRSMPRAVLYVEYLAQDDPAELDQSRGLLERAVGSSPLITFDDAASMQLAWGLRKAAEPLLHGVHGNRKPITFVEDNAVPVERLGEFVTEFRRIVARHGTTAAFFAHASVGVLHIRPVLSLRDPVDQVHMRQIAVQAADLARSLGGVMSGEHGDGRVRSPLLERYYGPEIMGAFAKLKSIFDPQNLLNPGNIVQRAPVESITDRTRISPQSSPLPLAQCTTYFDFSDQGGLTGAAEMCNGAGICRKKSGGTMCPSYMATLDERHSTRGRGNALRLAISGQFGSEQVPDWNDEQTRNTLDLCLSCKACKSECPSNVDIARLKAEYTAQSLRAAGRIPLRLQAQASIRSLCEVGALAPTLANWLAGLGISRQVLEWLAGIDHRRSLPRLSRSLAKRWCPDAGTNTNQPTVVLFADCFTNHFEPHIGLAARRVLEACGYRVELADVGCCGRAAISSGVLGQAVDQAQETLAGLMPWLARSDVRGFVFLEPSCLSAVKDDWLSLRMSVPREVRADLASRSYLVDEFIENKWSDHPRRPDATLARRPAIHEVLLHPHCHQNALWGEASSAGLLRRLAGQRLKVLDAGCCGMAGSFGYDKTHFDLSNQVFDQALGPAVRTATPNTVLAASGTSCRHQIKDATGVEALHPIQLFDMALADEEVGPPANQNR